MKVIMGKKQATILTPDDLNTNKAHIPNSWKQVRGTLENADIDPVEYQKEVRSEQTFAR